MSINEDLGIIDDDEEAGEAIDDDAIPAGVTVEATPVPGGPDPAGAQPTAEEAKDIEKTLAILVEFRRLGVRRRVDPQDVETDADRALLHISKDIVECEELNAIGQHDNRTRLILKTYTSPSKMKSGIYITKTSSAAFLYDVLTQRFAEREGLCQQFYDVYQAAADATRARLGSLADELEWPDLDKVKRAFSARFQYMSFDVPEALKAIRIDIFERERAKATAQWQEALEEAQGVLRARTAEFVDKAVERMTMGDNGKRKCLTEAGLKKMGKFIDLFDDLNVADDTALAGLVGQMRDLVAGVSPELLKSNETVYARVADGFQAIQKELGSLLTDAPTRRIRPLVAQQQQELPIVEAVDAEVVEEGVAAQA